MVSAAEKQTADAVAEARGSRLAPDDPDARLALRRTVFLDNLPPDASERELAGMLAAGEVRIVPESESLRSSLWPRVWALAEDSGDVSDGTEAWWLASQGAAAAGAGAEPSAAGSAVVAASASELADEALAEWLEFFAKPSRERFG